MTYDMRGTAPLDYLPCRYGSSRLLFRGPKRDLSAPHIAFIGSTETYGKFIETPFPALVEKSIGSTCVNFGQSNAGIDVFCQDAFLMNATRQAEITVVQVLGAHNMTNRFYSVHPRRNDRFVQASTLLKTIYREVDFADFHFNKHMLDHLMTVSMDRFEVVRQELREAWLARMRTMLKRIGGKTILLWLSDRAPCQSDHESQICLASDPLFVTRDMIADLTDDATKIVEVVVSPVAQAAGTAGMILSELDVPAAQEMLGPMAHQEVADALVAAIHTLR